MADDDDITAEEDPVPGPGVTAWLAGVIGTPRQSQANTPPPLPIGYGPERQARRVEIHLPEEVVVAEGGTLQRIEIRGLPIGVSLTAGSAMKDGFWQLDPADLYGIAALVPDGIDMPFSVMLKGVFIGDDPETPWTELTGYEFTDDGETRVSTERPSEPKPQPDPESQPTSEPEPEISSEPEPVAAQDTEPIPGPDEELVSEPEPISDPEPEADLSPTMVVIDLDVSVGTEDPNVLEDITLHFSGLPAGAILTAGDVDGAVWSVPASALSDLAVVIPEQTPDFELEVEMEIAGASPQSATIQVDNTPQPVDPDSAFRVNLAGGGAGRTRVSVYTDGVAAYDRVVNWSAAPGGMLSLLLSAISGMLLSVEETLSVSLSAAGEKRLRWRSNSTMRPHSRRLASHCQRRTNLPASFASDERLMALCRLMAFFHALTTTLIFCRVSYHPENATKQMGCKYTCCSSFRVKYA